MVSEKLPKLGQKRVKRSALYFIWVCPIYGRVPEVAKKMQRALFYCVLPFLGSHPPDLVAARAREGGHKIGGTVFFWDNLLDRETKTLDREKKNFEMAP